MLRRGPNGMRPLEILAEMPGEGLEPKSHHLKRHHELMLRRVPNGMRPLEFLAEMPGEGLGLYRHHLHCRMLSRVPMA